MAEQSTAQPITTGKLAPLLAAAQAKHVQLGFREPRATARCNWQSSIIVCFCAWEACETWLTGTPATDVPGVPKRKLPNAVTSDKSPGVSSGDLGVMLAEL